jgi:hypothetical protein
VRDHDESTGKEEDVRIQEDDEEEDVRIQKMKMMNPQNEKRKITPH